jgi:hypothetical protein
VLTFDEWWRASGQIDEGGKDDWRQCWDAALERGVSSQADGIAKLLFDELDRAGFIEFTTDWNGLSGSAKERFRAIALTIVGYDQVSKR